MIREYRADLTVFDPEREAPYQKSIIVNDPLSYKGITFYLADSFPLEEYFVVVREQATGREQAFRVPAGRDVAWQGAGISFRIEELKRDQDGTVSQARIRFAADDNDQPSVFWMEDQGTVTIGRLGEDFTFSFRQLYSTLLLATRDPGVPVLFFGCILMVVGLAISLSLSHRRIWVLITAKGKQGSRILISGAGNKNKPAFERRFHELVSRIEQDAGVSVPKKNP
jgi:cytochrome c biogenesis protein